jgi:hypothetical protein
MPRQGRLNASGMLHHVMPRELEGIDLARDDKDWEELCCCLN